MTTSTSLILTFRCSYSKATLWNAFTKLTQLKFNGTGCCAVLDCIVANVKGGKGGGIVLIPTDYSTNASQRALCSICVPLQWRYSGIGDRGEHRGLCCYSDCKPRCWSQSLHNLFGEPLCVSSSEDKVYSISARLEPHYWNCPTENESAASLQSRNAFSITGLGNYKVVIDCNPK